MTLKHLVAPVRQHLVPILEEALDACVERHTIADGRGADNFSFGTDAWSLPANLFRESSSDGAIPFVLTPEKGCVLSFMGHTFRHHRVGETEADDIETSFPNGANAVTREASKQLDLPGALGQRFFDESIIVVAYMANPIDGLCAVYLTTIGKVERERIMEWGNHEVVWRRSEALVSPGIREATVPPETIPVPTVTRRVAIPAATNEKEVVSKATVKRHIAAKKITDEK